MSKVTIIVCTATETFEFPLDADAAITVGRSSASDVAALAINDAGLSRLHATLHRAGDDVWITDEDSTNGTQVNGEEISAEGFALSDGDEITLGDETTITVRINDRDNYLDADQNRLSSSRVAESGESPKATRRANVPPLPIIALLAAAFLGIVGCVALGVYALTNGNNRNTSSDITGATPLASPEASILATSSPVASPSTLSTSPTPLVVLDSNPSLTEQSPGTEAIRLYRQMSDEEKMEFIARRARHISMMMTPTGRPYEFNNDALVPIKYWVDAFAGRVGARGTHLWGGDLRAVFGRGIPHAPMISRAFRENGVPPVVGLYLPLIETEYVNIQTENHARAKGLFQFIPGTARAFGINPDDRTNVPVMAGAAARHIRSNMIQFGDDSMSVAFAIAGYNRATHSLLRDLRTVISNTGGDTTAKERDFWTLIANKHQLDHYFQNENKNYVPRFFAAAIIGETPLAFDLQIRQFSTFATEQSASAGATPSREQ